MIIRRLVLVAMVTVLASRATCSYRSDSGNTGTPLSVSLTSDRNSVKMSESLLLTISIKNVSNHPIFVYGKLNWGLSSSLFLFVEDDKGKDVPMNYLEDALPPMPSPKDKAVFIKLNPELFFGTTRTDKLSDLVPKPGTYYLHVLYHGAVSRRFAAGTPAWGTEDPPILSNKVKIEVQ